MPAKISMLFAACLFSAVANGGEMYRWTDKEGRVHYSDSVPDSQKANARTVDTGSSLTEAQRRQAERRAAMEKSILDRRARANRADSEDYGVPSDTRAGNPKGGCEEAWRRYRESQACFAPYKLANGAVKAEAFTRCVDVAEPECR